MSDTEPGPAAAGQPPDASDAMPDADAIVIRLGAGRFAVQMTSVAEVGHPPVVTRVPGMPDWLAGVANWRGRVLPVLDLRRQLGADPAPLGSQARLVVLTDGGLVVGLVAEAVDGTTALTDVAPFPAAAAPTGATLLCGQAPREDGPLAVLDVPAVMRLREALPRGRRTA